MNAVPHLSSSRGGLRFWTVVAVLTGLIGFGLSPTIAKLEDQERWDAKYDTEDYIFGTEPAAFLKEHVALLPKGKVLDIAMGEGRNGVFLATKGFDVTGVDISPVGLSKAQDLAEKHGVKIETRIVDLETYELPPNSYEVILCLYYMQRSMIPQIKRALKPGGMAVVETYNLEHLKYRPDFNRQYLLEPNELLRWFADLKVLRYQFVDDGKAAYSSILVQKPAGSATR